jgi:group II intron reverse transcriptase/maturase
MGLADRFGGPESLDKRGVIRVKPELVWGKGSSLLRSPLSESEGVLMLPETAMRRLEALATISRQGKQINGLFRLLEIPLLWYEAYANIYANAGAITPGVDATTLDGFSEKRVTAIITRLKTSTYRFRPTRRTYVPKANGKKRPLGISSGDDKLVQEVVRLILEKIYEPIFEESSHGFRPGRSPHTALETIKQEWTAVKWLIDMDLRSYFDTINHDLLMSLLQKRIGDTRFLRLIRAMLDAGYLEDWTYHSTYSGVPQGSIVSPILANIYLHELDLFMKNLKEQFDQGKRRKKYPAYHRHTERIRHLRKKTDMLKGKEDTQQLQHIQNEIRQVDRLRKRLPSVDPFDSGYRRLYFCRYADDYVIGIIGSKADAERVRQEVRRFIEETLKLTIAEEKSHIRHSREGVIFLGYEIKTYSGNRLVKVKRGPRYILQRTISERIQLHIPTGKLERFCQTKRYGDYHTMRGASRGELTLLSDAEILLTYNGELRGLANYYALACQVKQRMNKLAYIWQTSFFKTLAHKHCQSVHKMSSRLKTDDGYVLTVPKKDGIRTLRLFRLKDLRPSVPSKQDLDTLPNTLALTLSRSELIRRLNSNQCEYCETTQGPFEVHHVRKLKDIESGKTLWQQMMIARRRKTLVLCRSCHHLLHEGKLSDQETVAKKR